MASPAWYNENENRAYPFLNNGDQPANRLIVDAGFVVGSKSRFKSGSHTIHLVAIRRQGLFFHLDFESTAPGLFGVTLTFSRHAADGDFACEFVDSGTAGLSASSDSLSQTNDRGPCDEPLWSGFVVTGRIDAFETLLPGDGSVTYDAIVEPALVQNLSETFVSKFGVANADRTTVTNAEGCGDTTVPDEVVHVNYSCVVGDVVFSPGFNANVRQNIQDNSITIGAAVGDGAGQPCETVPKYVGEVPPEDSNLIEGGPRCNETIRSVNGVGGPMLTLTAGRGVTVTSSPETNTLLVNVNMSGLSLCFDSISSRSESC